MMSSYGGWLASLTCYLMNVLHVPMVQIALSYFSYFTQDRKTLQLSHWTSDPCSLHNHFILKRTWYFANKIMDVCNSWPSRECWRGSTNSHEDLESRFSLGIDRTQPASQVVKHRTNLILWYLSIIVKRYSGWTFEDHKVTVMLECR